MATAVAEATKVSQKLRQLLQSLRKGQQPLSKLPQADEDTVGEAFACGYIQLGMPEYTLVVTSGNEEGIAGKLKRDKHGKNVLDDRGRQQLDKEYAVRLDGGFSWMNYDQPSRKSVNEVLAEELPDGVELHLRLTTAGNRHAGAAVAE